MGPDPSRRKSIGAGRELVVAATLEPRATPSKNLDALEELVAFAAARPGALRLRVYWRIPMRDRGPRIVREGAVGGLVSDLREASVPGVEFTVSLTRTVRERPRKPPPLFGDEIHSQLNDPNTKEATTAALVEFDAGVQAIRRAPELAPTGATRDKLEALRSSLLDVARGLYRAPGRPRVDRDVVAQLDIAVDEICRERPQVIELEQLVGHAGFTGRPERISKLLRDRGGVAWKGRDLPKPSPTTMIATRDPNVRAFQAKVDEKLSADARLDFGEAQRRVARENPALLEAIYSTSRTNVAGRPTPKSRIRSKRTSH